MKKNHWFVVLAAAVLGTGVAIFLYLFSPPSQRADKGGAPGEKIKRAAQTGGGAASEDARLAVTDVPASAPKEARETAEAARKEEREACAACAAGDTGHRHHSGPALPLEAEFAMGVLDKREGEQVSFALPGGGEVRGVIQFAPVKDGEVISVQGRLTQPQPGFFFFQRQTMPGTAGAMVGVVRFDKGEIAYQVKPDEDGQPELVETRIDEVICHNYSASEHGAAKAEVAESETAEGPEDHPEETNIPTYQNGVPSYQSMPSAVAVLYLDFDGQEGPIQGWSVTNAAPSGLSAIEMRRTWEHVSEDFAPFNINVTTDKRVYESAPENSRQRCLISPSSPIESGVALLGSFGWTGDVPCWAGYRGGKVGYEVVAHELGHTVGLAHDGRTTPSEEYYGGQGSGETGWAPIMGNSYYKNLSQWSKGEYSNADNVQDDLTIISNNNNVDYRTDDHGNDTGSAGYLDIFPGGTVDSKGIIETRTDSDVLKFTTTASGTVSLVVNPSTQSGNLDILVELLNSAGSVIASNNPDLEMDASLTATSLSAGVYYVRVSGVGRGDPLVNGYSDYASLGHFTVSGTVPSAVLPERFDVAENSANGTAVGTVSPNNNHGSDTVSYAIAAGNGSGAFTINSVTGALTVANGSQLDFETGQPYAGVGPVRELLVGITNATRPSLSETVRVVVTVSDVNESPSLGAVAGFSLNDDVPVGFVLKRMSASDQDLHDIPVFSISAGNAGGAFAIDASSGLLTVASPLDGGTTPHYDLTVRVTDGDGLSVSTVVAIDVVDVAVQQTRALAVEDFDSYTGQPYGAFTSASLLGGQGGWVMTANGANVRNDYFDGGLAGNVAYLNSSTTAVGHRHDGVPYLSASATKAVFRMTGRVGNSRYSRAGVAFDNGGTANPGFIMGSFAASGWGVHIGSGTAFQAAAAATSTDGFATASTANATGAVDMRLTIDLVNRTARFEWSADGFIWHTPSGMGNINMSNLNTTAADGTNWRNWDSLYVRCLNVGSTVDNLTLSVPGNSAPVAQDATLAVSEGVPSGASVGTVVARDPGASDSLVYAITAGNAGGAFAINARTGEITVATTLDYETTNSYGLTVSVTDQGGLSDTATITITVSNVVGDDSDADGLEDAWEVTHFGSVVAHAGGGDADSDGLSNAKEQMSGADPNEIDSDGDFYSDGHEVLQHSDLLDAQSIPNALAAACWKFDGAISSASTRDLVGALTGTLLDGAAISADGTGRTGQPGDRALDLGSTVAAQRMEVDDPAFLRALGTGNELTISFWQKLTGSLTNMTSIWAQSPGVTDGRGIAAFTPWSNGTVYFDCGNSSSPQNRIYGTPSGVTWTAWNHIALVRKPGVAQIWVNGVMVASGSSMNPLFNDFTELVLGARTGGVASMQGWLDDVAVFRKGLGSDAIAALSGGADPLSILETPLETQEVAAETFDAYTGEPYGAFTGASLLDGQGNWSMTANGGNLRNDFHPGGLDGDVVYLNSATDAIGHRVDAAPYLDASATKAVFQFTGRVGISRYSRAGLAFDNGGTLNPGFMMGSFGADGWGLQLGSGTGFQAAVVASSTDGFATASTANTHGVVEMRLTMDLTNLTGRFEWSADGVIWNTPSGMEEIDLSALSMWTVDGTNWLKWNSLYMDCLNAGDTVDNYALSATQIPIAQPAAIAGTEGTAAGTAEPTSGSGQSTPGGGTTNQTTPDGLTVVAGPGPQARAMGFNAGGGFKIQVTDLNPAKSYKLTRGTDLATYPDQVGSTITGQTGFTFTDDAPPAGKSFYRLEEVTP